ncbi:hypothetical protein B0H11DRAFT_1317283 [Mycena galericulata]|nr:hypothetical protein B0H11DRAFT_1317283 [Mycena galericulata]
MTSTAPITPGSSVLRAAHDAARAMSGLSAGTNISEADRRALQDFYADLESRRALLEEENASLNTEGPATHSAMEGDIHQDGVPQDADLTKAFEFTTFLTSLDPTEVGTQLLIEGNDHVTGALGIIEKGGNFLEHAPMTNILQSYERIKSREASLKAGGQPVSMVNARIYWSEANAFASIVKMLIVLDLESLHEETVEVIA